MSTDSLPGNLAFQLCKWEPIKSGNQQNFTEFLLLQTKLRPN